MDTKIAEVVCVDVGTEIILDGVCSRYSVRIGDWTAGYFFKRRHAEAFALALADSVRWERPRRERLKQTPAPPDPVTVQELIDQRRGIK